MRKNIALLVGFALSLSSPAGAVTRISGTVVDAGSERPVAGATLNAEIGMSPPRDVGITDSAGRFELNADDWPKSDRNHGTVVLQVSHPHYAPVVQHITFTPGTGKSGIVLGVTPTGPGSLSQAVRDALLGARDATGRTIGFATFDLDTAGIAIDAARLEGRLLRRLQGSMTQYLQAQNAPDELCGLSFVQLPGAVDLLNYSAAREAGDLLNALALIGGELRVRTDAAGPRLEVSTTFFPIPSTDSLLLPPQRVFDQIALDPAQPSAITGEAGSAWAHYAAIVLALREAREGERLDSLPHLVQARDLLAAVQRTLPAGEGSLHRWLAHGLRLLDARIRP